MGFRNLEWFNQALLAKSVWRIIRRPFSLVARVLKESYFPNTSIFEASVSTHASSLWRGLIWGRKIIFRGSRWRIATGDTVNARTERWLTRPGDFKIRDVSRIPEGATVGDLKLPCGNWNETRLREWLTEEDANEVLKIPRSSSLSKDVLCWHYSRGGDYLVKSGYRIMADLQITGSKSDPRPMKCGGRAYGS